jgi:hypothetical protein
MSATELHIHLRELESERMVASLEGFVSDSAYMADLHQEITETRHVYMGAVVTEIASLRAVLSAPLQG